MERLPKVNLTENQFQLLRDYLQLLETIDEGFFWIVSHFLQGQNSNSVQKILKDVIHAFHEIHFANLTDFRKKSPILKECAGRSPMSRWEMNFGWL
ncbi:hypothetical protein [Bacillus smithii]|uniref:hypothetical protein n=1 Tax=Bacillus smithii TaxID=1479 RepID=UPI0022DEBD7A|nr:hypothetical protein [Bacillus smithii]